MRQIFRPLLALSLTALWGANAFDVPIFTFDRNHNSRVEESAIPGNVARLLLERRMKSVDDSVLGSFDEDTVKCLNQFGGEQRSLFGTAGGKESLQKNLVLLEGIDTQSLISIRKSYPNDLVTSHPSKNLVDDELLASILETDPNDKADAKLCAFHSNNVSAGPEAYEAARECLVRDPTLRAIHILDKELLAHVDSVDSWIGTASPVSVLRLRFKQHGGHMDPILINHIKDILQRLGTAASGGKRQITALLSPESLMSRGLIQSVPSRHNKKEESLFNSLSRTSDQVSIPSTLLPVCYKSNSTCAEATNNCSGHGSCYKKHTAKHEAGATDCFACKCVETRTVGKDGKVRKMRWGGPACQKRDISSPFFLIAGVTITVTVSVITAIGMLYSIGQDELPSVIGAGVAPAKMQK